MSNHGHISNPRIESKVDTVFQRALRLAILDGLDLPPDTFIEIVERKTGLRMMEIAEWLEKEVPRGK